MVIYISGGITNVPDYKRHFKKAERRLRKHFDVINPAKVLSKMPKNTPYEVYMDMSLAMLKNSDLIYMLKNWNESRGACAEHGYALEHGIPIVYERKQH